MGKICSGGDYCGKCNSENTHLEWEYHRNELEFVCFDCGYYYHSVNDMVQEETYICVFPCECGSNLHVWKSTDEDGVGIGSCMSCDVSSIRVTHEDALHLNCSCVGGATYVSM